MKLCIVVDTQKAITNIGLYQFDLFESHVKELINKARHNNIEVLFVRHDMVLLSKMAELVRLLLGKTQIRKI